MSEERLKEPENLPHKFSDLYKVTLKKGASDYLTHNPYKEKDRVECATTITPEPSDEKAVELSLAKLDELRKTRKSVQLYLDICVRCGACIKQCHYYLSTQDPRNTPVGRAELLRQVYRKHFTISGKIFGGLVGAKKLTPEMIKEDWWTYFYQCSECRRCSVFCPYGIDTAEITMAAREVLASAGHATKYITEVLAKVYLIGNNLGIPKPALVDTLDFIEDELEEDWGFRPHIPLDEKGHDVCYIPPSADFFANADTLIGALKLFIAAKLSYTFSSYSAEHGNFGLFMGYEDLAKVNKRMVDATIDLGCKVLMFGECGHAWRVGRQYMEAFHGPLPFKYLNILEWVDSEIKKGTFMIDKSKNDDYIVTIHDPCNFARGGDLIEEPRNIIKACCNNFRDMPPEVSREQTFCCGGGGGLLTEEIMDLRFMGVKPKAMALKETGANYLAAPCAIDKAQFSAVLSHWRLGDVQVGGILDLMGWALICPDDIKEAGLKTQEGAATKE